MLLKNVALVLCALALLGLAGCEEDDDSDTSTESGLMVVTISGGEVSPEGTWLEACNAGGGTDGRQDGQTFDGYEVIGFESVWVGDATCMGDPTETTEQYYVEIEPQDVGTATWAGGTPPDADYPAEVNVSQMDFTGVDDPEGDQGSDILVIDDEAEPMLLYTSQANADLGTYPTELDPAAGTFVE